MKNITLILALFLMSFTPPKKDVNGIKTDYSYYSDKYYDMWELSDSVVNYKLDTIYTYKLNGQYFVFDQNGKRIINNINH
jgi:hypothetical protein